MITLYDYYRSTACFRVRIALNLKAIPFERVFVNLVKNGGEQHSEDYRSLNPQGLVPTLTDPSKGVTLTQSLSILEYLEEAYPEPPLLPQDIAQKAAVRAFALTIACDIHPLNNLRVLNYLKNTLNVTPEQKTAWYHHWLNQGFAPLESALNASSTPFCFGHTPSMADICLIPQLYNAHRFELPMSDYPRLQQLYDHALTLGAFKEAFPDNQPDAAP